MADIKNTFIKGKMNKDLDSRVVPEGEYREGTNIQILNSEIESTPGIDLNSSGQR